MVGIYNFFLYPSKLRTAKVFKLRKDAISRCGDFLISRGFIYLTWLKNTNFHWSAQGFHWIKPAKKNRTCISQTQLSMKIAAKYLSLVLFLLASCGKSGQQEHHDQDDTTSNNPNQALYDQVMDIHNEVMPKSDEIY